MPKAWPYERGYALLTSPGETRPGTCRAPMGWGFTMPKAWPYKSGEYLMGYGRIDKRDPGRVALLWVAGGEKEREVATKATSLQSRISS